jgi:acetyl-CoA acetyltransferase
MHSLRDKYCIVGVGETEYSKSSGRTTRAMAVEAIRNALLDAGLRGSDIDGMMS